MGNFLFHRSALEPGFWGFLFQPCFQIAVLRMLLCSEMLPLVVAEHFLQHPWPCLALQPPSQPRVALFFLRLGHATVSLKRPGKLRAKKCSDGASRSVINTSHCHFWVDRSCFVFCLSVLWTGLAKCAKTESSESLRLRCSLASLCI